MHSTLVNTSQPLQGALERLTAQRRRAHAVHVDDPSLLYQSVEEFGAHVLAGGALIAVMRDDGLLEVLSPFWPQRVVVLLGLVAEDLCAKHSDAIDA